MSKRGKIDQVNRNLDFPEVNIIQYSLVRRQESWTNPNRNAPYWRFYRNLTSGAKIIFEKEEIELSPDKVILIPPNVTYASLAQRPFSQFYIHFIWNNAVASRSPIILPAADGINNINDIELFFEEDEKLFSIRIYAILLKYLANISAELHSKEKGLDSRIIKAVALMNENIRCRNTEIAQAVYMSCDNFQRIFKREMGVSARQYLIARRMEKAQAYLQDPTLTIDEIAFHTGFSDRYQFSKTFSTFFKIPPVTYRKRLTRS